MNKRNKIKAFFAVLCGLSLQLAWAQHEVRLNFSNLIFYELHAEYEYIFQQNKSVTLFTGYVYGFPDAAQPNKYFYIGPEYRVYVSRKKAASGFYFGFYMRYKTGYYPTTQNERGNDINNPNNSLTISTDGNMDYTKLVAGVSMGAKWVAPIGFTYGFFVGGGVNIRSDYTFNKQVSHADLFTEESYRYSYSSTQWDSDYWDLRFGIMVGWRF